MSDILTISPSQMDRILVCPPSVVTEGDGERIEEYSDRAPLGTAVHALLARLVLGQSVERTDIIARAKADNLDVDELSILYYIGRRMWEKVSSYFLEPQCEVEMMSDLAPGIRLSGTADLVSVSGDLATVGDWKSGRETEHMEQVRAYAWLVAQEHPEVENVSATLLWIRGEKAQSWNYGRAELNEWRERVVDTLVNPRRKNVYRPGEACTYCPKRVHCGPRKEYERSALALFEGDGGVTVPNDEVPALYEKIQALERALKQARSEITKRVHAAGGTLAGKDGHVLTHQTRERKDLDVIKAWPILTQEFDADEMAQMVKVSLPKALSAAAARVPRNMKAIEKEALTTRLEEVDAITTTETHALQLKRAHKEIGA